MQRLAPLLGAELLRLVRVRVGVRVGVRVRARARVRVRVRVITFIMLWWKVVPMTPPRPGPDICCSGLRLLSGSARSSERCFLWSLFSSLKMGRVRVRVRVRVS